MSLEVVQEDVTEDVDAIDSAIKFIVKDGLAADIAIARAGALLATVCKMTSDPVRALRYAMDILGMRLKEWEVPPKDAS